MTSGSKAAALWALMASGVLASVSCQTAPSSAPSAATAPAPVATAPATVAATAPARPHTPIDQPASKMVDRNWAAHHQRLLDRAKQGDVDLYLEGDSITDFFATTGRPVYQKEFGGWTTADFGISGDTCQNVLWRLQNGELDGVNPKAIMLMIGTNNSGNYSAEEIAQGVTAIVNLLKEKEPQAKILLLAIFPRNATAANAIRIKLNQTNEIIAKLDDGKQVKYMNINDKFLDQDGNLSRDIMRDLLHPTAKGYQIWADAVKPQLTEWLGQPAATQPITTAP